MLGQHVWWPLALPEPGYYLAGTKSYGRAPTFLITTANEQVRSIAAALAGDLAAADEVQLVLPETGVCSLSLPLADEAAGAPAAAVAASPSRPRPAARVAEAR
jgi:hypothetical protein